MLDLIVSKFYKVPCLGMWLNALANLFFALSYILTKDIITEQNALTVVFIRMVIQSSVLLPFFTRKKIPPFGPMSDRILLLATALCFTGFHLSLIYSFSLMPVADASAVSMTYPVLVTLIGPWALNEKFSKLYLFNALLSVTGVLFIDRPTFIFGGGQTSTRFTGVYLALFCAVLNALLVIFSRKVKFNCSLTISTLYPSLSAFTYILLLLATGGVMIPPCGADGVYSMLAGMVNSIGLVLYFKSYTLEEAGPLSIVGTVEVPFVMFLEVLILGYRPQWTSIIGILLVFLGTVLTAFSKWKQVGEREPLLE